MPLACGAHRAFVYERGGLTPVGELTPLSQVRWERVRDDISTAEVTIPTSECCVLLGDLRAILHELHIYRNDVIVWQGPITRIEYQFDRVDIFAADVLWQSTRRVMLEGYDNSYPNIGFVVDRMDWLLRSQCYAQDGDPWNVVPHLFPMRHNQGEPRTSRKVFPYSTYVWDDFDAYAEDSGADYTVVNRNIYYYDYHYAWKVIPALDESHLSQWPRIVEYGNQLATRSFVGNGRGDSGYAGTPAEWDQVYGWVDDLTILVQEGTEEGATPEEIAEWNESAIEKLSGTAPTPVAVVIPENSTLLTSAPWGMDDLVPGAWFEINVTSLCREVTEWQRLHRVNVFETAPTGETVQISCVAAPSERIDPP